MTVGIAVIADVVIVAHTATECRLSGRIGHRQNAALKWRGNIQSSLGQQLMLQRHGDAFGYRSYRLEPFGRSDKICGTELVIGSPATPVGELFHHTLDVRLIEIA